MSEPFFSMAFVLVRNLEDAQDENWQPHDQVLGQGFEGDVAPTTWVGVGIIMVGGLVIQFGQS